MLKTRKSLILTSVIAAIMATATVAKAEQPVAWPRYPADGVDGGVAANRGTVYKAPAAATAPNIWADAFIPFGSAGTPVGLDPTPAAELDALRKGYIAYRRARYNALVEQGGCNADFLPVEFAAPCWQGGHSTNPTGGQVGESLGGDGGNSSGSVAE